jgi:hypothetical protein
MPYIGGGDELCCGAVQVTCTENAIVPMASTNDINSQLYCGYYQVSICFAYSVVARTLV